MVARNRRVEGDEAKSAQIVDAIHRIRRGDLTEQGGAEGATIVVIAHDPDHPSTEARGGGLHDAAQCAIRLGFALVGEIAGHDDRLRSALRALQLVEELAQVLGAVDGIVELAVTTQQVSVAEMKQEVVRPRVLGDAEGHGSSIRVR